MSVHGRALVGGVLRGAGVNPASYRLESLARRIPACLRALSAGSEAEANRLVATDERRRDVALNSLLLGVTDFFRDTDSYQELRSAVLPALLRRRVGLRVLSAGCSNGAELYSLGMCLGEQGALGSAELLGIDCRRAAVETAATGFYRRDSVEGVPPEFRLRYLRFQGGGYQMCAGLRSRSRWEVGDLWRFEWVACFDLIACRNLAIYLAPEALESLWRKLHAALTPGGVLFTGKAERPRCGFERIGPCLYRKVQR